MRGSSGVLSRRVLLVVKRWKGRYDVISFAITYQQKPGPMWVDPKACECIVDMEMKHLTFGLIAFLFFGMESNLFTAASLI